MGVGFYILIFLLGVWVFENYFFNGFSCFMCFECTVLFFKGDVS